MPERRGHCHLCGTFGPLTFEHVPPARCFNSAPIALWTLRQLTAQVDARTSISRAKSPERFRRGLGAYSLCDRCNGATAAWYGDAFARWTVQALRYLPVLRANACLLPFTIFPLRVVKQIATMLVAVAPSYVLNTPHMTALRRLILNPLDFGIVPSFRVYTYLCPEGLARFSSYAGAILAGYGPVVVFAEVARAPMGYCVLGAGEAERKAAADIGLLDITGFLNHQSRTLATVHLRLPVLRPTTATPLSYAQ